MALTKVVAEDKIEVVGDYKHVQVRTRTSVIETGVDDNGDATSVELSSSYHRHVLTCSIKTGNTVWADTDISGESTEVQAICNAVWTDAVKTAYQTLMDAAETP